MGWAALRRSEMTRLFLVRHAQADWEPDEGRPLSGRGRRDALRVAELLAPADVAAIYSSPARRAIETVEPLAERVRLGPILIQDLREREMPVQRAGEFEAIVRGSWLEPEVVTPGAEPLLAAQARGLDAVRSVLSRHSDRAVVVSTHGNLLALVVNALDPAYGYEFWRGLTFPDVYELQFRGPRLEGMRRVWETQPLMP
jgi:2,3-bisphosphoglycerate-dependent phosphoglycerate mutase